MVEILSKCTACGLCESINSDVFKVNGIAFVDNNMVTGNEEDCVEAATQCPVGAIRLYG